MVLVDYLMERDVNQGEKDQQQFKKKKTFTA